tara:strand:+ start:1136 stop:1843 length:708 start_codon:yes stop_codon:yes gene_type:complete
MHWRDKALNHARKDAPDESVGLLLNVKGKEVYFACQNISNNSQQTFILDPNDYLKASKLGDVIAVIHSHPTTTLAFSESDKVNCEKHKLPWYIVDPRTAKWIYREPDGYVPELLGRRWIWGVTDCWSLVRDYYKKERGIILRDYDRSMSPEEFLENPLFESYAWRTGFRELRLDETLQEGDVLLMSIMHPTLNHVAIYLGDMVLHHLTDRLSCREPYSLWLLKCTAKRYRYVENS